MFEALRFKTGETPLKRSIAPGLRQVLYSTDTDAEQVSHSDHQAGN